METKFSILNGRFIEGDQSVLTPNSIYALGQFSLNYVFRACENEIFFFREQMELIQREADFFRLPLLPHMSKRKPVFQRELKRLLNKNKLFAGAGIKLILWRESGSTNYLIQAFETESNLYELPDKGALISTLDLPVKTVHPASILPSFSSQLWKVGEIYCNENGFDQCFILSGQDSIVEVPFGNLFVLRKEQLITPDFTTGAVQMVLRERIIKLGKKIGLDVITSEAVTPELLRQADEIFWTDNICGLKWAMGWKDRRYFCRFARVLVNELNIESRTKTLSD